MDGPDGPKPSNDAWGVELPDPELICDEGKCKSVVDFSMRVG